jgi:ribonuclease Z
MVTLTFLGTSSGVPTRNRNLSALALQTGHGRSWWLIDCGEATQHRLQHLPLSVHDLDGICITHVHGDHSYGLPGLLASAAMTGRTRPLIVVGTLALKAWLDATMLHTTLGLTYPLVFVDVDADHEVHGEVHREHHPEFKLAIERHPLSHRVPSVAYRFAVEHARYRLDTQALREAGVAAGESWGRLQRGEDVRLDDGRLLAADDFRLAQVRRAVVVVGGDNDTPELLHEACEGAQLLIHESTYTEATLQKIGPGPTHSSALRVARFAQRRGLPNLILTHFSPRYDNPAAMAQLRDEALAHYHGTLFLAHDFARFEVDADGTVRPLDPAA